LHKESVNYFSRKMKDAPERILYLAVPAHIYNTFFQKPFIQKVTQRKNMHIIVYEPEQATIAVWMS